MGCGGAYLLHITITEHGISLQFHIVVFVVLCVTNVEVSGKLKCLISEKYSSLKYHVVFMS